jgi:hypothetical protein
MFLFSLPNPTRVTVGKFLSLRRVVRLGLQHETIRRMLIQHIYTGAQRVARGG